MGLTAERPFKSQAGRSSSLNILNQNDYIICGKQWISEDDVNGVYNEGCARLVVDLPVPVVVIEEEEEEDVVVVPDDDDDKEDSKSGASSLATSALAAIALYALT